MLIAEFPFTVMLTPFGIPIIAIICVFTWLAISSISEEVGKVMRHRADVDLKLELMARGMNSEQIVAVVQAGRDGSGPAVSQTMPYPGATANHGVTG